VATLNSANQSETERAGLRVIRARIAYRETDGSPAAQTPAAARELAEEQSDGLTVRQRNRREAAPRLGLGGFDWGTD
jgi:hypothetical protein